MSDPVIKTIEKYAEEKGLPKLSGMQFNRVTTLLLCELIRDIKEMKSNVKKPGFVKMKNRREAMFGITTNGFTKSSIKLSL